MDLLRAPSLRCLFCFNRDLYDEKGVMNNYFGIGLDAKISLDFHLKREGHPEKCRYDILQMKVVVDMNVSNDVYC